MKTAVELWTEVAAHRERYGETAQRVASGEPGLHDVLARMAQTVAEAETAARAQQAHEATTTWRPQHAPHVEGSWTQRTFDDNGMPEPQTVKMKCEKCGTTWQVPCSSGLVRAHVQRFSLQHLHRDVLNHVPRKMPEDDE